MTDPMNDERHPLADDPLFAATRKLIHSNMRRQRDLAEAGFNLDTGSLLTHRIEMILNAVLPTDSPERLKFEHEWAQLVSGSLDNAEQAAARQRLAGPPRGGSGLIVPGR